MCQIERLENREENGGNTPDRYRALATWNSIKMNIYGFLQSTKGLKSPFHFEDGGYEIDSATLVSASSWKQSGIEKSFLDWVATPFVATTDFPSGKV